MMAGADRSISLSKREFDMAEPQLSVRSAKARDLA
ncbi:plasmid stabilization protein, partial [Mesorhizobium sp. M8A.F.Ca.ET.023.01.1.1]